MAREPLGRGSTEVAEVRHAQTSSKLVSHTQAAEAATNHENDYEPRRTALSLEYEATEGKRRRANPEAQRKQQKCDIHKQKQQARLVHTSRRSSNEP